MKGRMGFPLPVASVGVAEAKVVGPVFAETCEHCRMDGRCELQTLAKEIAAETGVKPLDVLKVLEAIAR